MSDYTPTTEEVRHMFATYGGGIDAMLYVSQEDRKLHGYGDTFVQFFDRWLAEVKAQAWEEGNKQAHQDIDGEWPTSYTPNPYRQGES